MNAAERLYSCPVCDSDPWRCTCLSKERVRRIAHVIGYPARTPAVAPETASQELVPVRVPRS